MNPKRKTPREIVTLDLTADLLEQVDYYRASILGEHPGVTMAQTLRMLIAAGLRVNSERMSNAANQAHG